MELDQPKKQVKQVTQEAQQSKEEELDTVELQKKLANMVMKVKDEQTKWKEERVECPTATSSFLSGRNGLEGNQDEGCG